MPLTDTSPVKRARLRRGMTQADLAEKCAERGVPVTDPHLSRIERGVFTPRPKLASVLAGELGLDIEIFETLKASVGSETAQ